MSWHETHQNPARARLGGVLSLHLLSVLPSPDVWRVLLAWTESNGWTLYEVSSHEAMDFSLVLRLTVGPYRSRSTPETGAGVLTRARLRNYRTSLRSLAKVLPTEVQVLGLQVSIV